MFSMWEKVSGAIMDAPHPWQHGLRRKRKVRPGASGHEKAARVSRTAGMRVKGAPAQLKAPANHFW